VVLRNLDGATVYFVVGLVLNPALVLAGGYLAMRSHESLARGNSDSVSSAHGGRTDPQVIAKGRIRLNVSLLRPIALG
jgi:hypothetical protein